MENLPAGFDKWLTREPRFDTAEADEPSLYDDVRQTVWGWTLEVADADAQPGTVEMSAVKFIGGYRDDAAVLEGVAHLDVGGRAFSFGGGDESLVTVRRVR